MDPKVSVFIGMSLDGFIARKDGDIKWLDNENKKVTYEEDFGFTHFMQSVDVLVMGRNTYEQVLTFDNWPYKVKRVIVLSTKDSHIPSDLSKIVTISQESPKELVKRLSGQGIKHVYVDGGFTIQSFLFEDLIDEITVTIVPILIGEGKSFVKSLPGDISLIRLKTTVFEFGFVQIKYRIQKKAP